MGYSIAYFLIIMLLRNHDHPLVKEILLDPRLDGLPVMTLFDLEQKLIQYRLPQALAPSFPHIDEIRRCFDVNSNCQPDEKAVCDLIGSYVPARHMLTHSTIDRLHNASSSPTR